MIDVFGQVSFKPWPFRKRFRDLNEFESLAGGLGIFAFLKNSYFEDGKHDEKRERDQKRNT